MVDEGNHHLYQRHGENLAEVDYLRDLAWRRDQSSFVLDDMITAIEKQRAPAAPPEPLHQPAAPPAAAPPAAAPPGPQIGGAPAAPPEPQVRGAPSTPAAPPEPQVGGTPAAPSQPVAAIEPVQATDSVVDDTDEEDVDEEGIQ